MLSLCLALSLAQANPVAAPDEETKAEGLSEAMVAKMTPEQLHDVLRHQRRQEDPPAVAIVAVVGFFAATIVVLLALLWAISRTHRQRHETIRFMVEKGQPIPKELLGNTRAPNDLRRGILLAAFGVGVAVFLAAVGKEHDHGAWTLGLVPFLVGLGYVISARLSKNTTAAA